LNQRPMGYEYNTAMTGNPDLTGNIRRGKQFRLVRCYLVLAPVSACFGVMWEQNGSRHFRTSPALRVPCASEGRS
jgi:hypothetical protein